MEKHKIGFVILHYLAKEETINCVSSIKEKVGTEDYLIVIVDNASSNGSGNELLEKYENDSKVKVLINRENLGFAKGMNVGFQYLKSGGTSSLFY
jgi:GT2 family glycosyltransferase